MDKQTQTVEERMSEIEARARIFEGDDGVTGHYYRDTAWLLAELRAARAELARLQAQLDSTEGAWVSEEVIDALLFRNRTPNDMED